MAPAYHSEKNDLETPGRPGSTAQAAQPTQAQPSRARVQARVM